MTEEHTEQQTQHEEQATGPDADTADATSGQIEEKPGEARAPEGATPASDLFDLMGDEGKQFKKPEPKPSAQKKDAKNTPTSATKKFPVGMEIHHAGQKLALPKEMTEAEVFTFLADDFPEVTADRAEIREDKHKGRLVVAFKSFKKG